jgi:hypothetical protein
MGETQREKSTRSEPRGVICAQISAIPISVCPPADFLPTEWKEKLIGIARRSRYPQKCLEHSRIRSDQILGRKPGSEENKAEKNKEETFAASPLLDGPGGCRSGLGAAALLPACDAGLSVPLAATLGQPDGSRISLDEGAGSGDLSASPRMALGCPDMISLGMEILIERALEIARSSQNPTQGMLLIRAKVLAFLDNGGLGVVCKEISVEKGQRSVPSSLPPLTDTRDKEWTHVLSEVLQTELKCMATEIVGFAAMEPMADKKILTCNLDNLMRTLLGDKVISFGVPLFRVDDEPPDPGESLPQIQEYDKSVHNHPMVVVCVDPDLYRKVDYGPCR